MELSNEREMRRVGVLPRLQRLSKKKKQPASLPGQVSMFQGQEASGEHEETEAQDEIKETP